MSSSNIDSSVRFSRSVRLSVFPGSFCTSIKILRCTRRRYQELESNRLRRVVWMHCGRARKVVWTGQLCCSESQRSRLCANGGLCHCNGAYRAIPHPALEVERCANVQPRRTLRHDVAVTPPPAIAESQSQFQGWRPSLKYTFEVEVACCDCSERLCECVRA